LRNQISERADWGEGSNRYRAEAMRVPSIATARFELNGKQFMAQNSDLQNRIQRIGAIVEQLESMADPNSRALAKELLESLMALHGAGLERILELASESGSEGEAFINKCGRDELVSGLLLIYGLHPDDLATRVKRALEKSHGFLESHSTLAELKSIAEDGTVTVQLHRKPNGGCGSNGELIRSTLEAQIQNAAPDASSIVVVETGLGTSGFVSVVQLQNGLPTAVLSSAQAARSGD
jgi:Fe-S cluster biogenesis protein NfuA